MILKKNIIAFFVIGIAGTLGHFVYKWSGNFKLLGYIFPVSESTWEHLKLLFFPAIIYFIISYYRTESKPKNFFPALAISVSCGMSLIVTIFYTISGVLGFNLGFVNIGIYFIGVIATICKMNKIIKSGKYSSKNALVVSMLYLIVMTLLFILFSYNPPKLGVFKIPKL